MRLCLNDVKNTVEWNKIGVNVPQYDIGIMVDNTKKNPKWLHFGAGNIFRGFIANLQQNLLNMELDDTGIIAADTFDYDIINNIYNKYDNLTLLVGLKSDGNNSMDVIASVGEAIKADSSDNMSFSRLKTIVRCPSLQMISFTITEKGYAVKDIDNNLLEIIKEDIKNGPSNPKHAMSFVTALLLERFNANMKSIALVSMDNCSHNGEKLREAILTVANGWFAEGYVDDSFISYISDESKVSFPWSMIDKITPRPDLEIMNNLKEIGFEDIEPITTSKNTYIAPFVNAEIPQYLVIEDKFPNGRPCLEKAGVYFTDRATVNNTEKMKVTTCLNPLHTALAIFGCLLGYKKISDEMKDSELSKLVNKIGYNEGLPMVVNPEIINPKDFIDEVINERLTNPFLPDTPQRIATDTSQKISIRFGETIKSYQAVGRQGELVYIPLTIAGWFRYLIGLDDEGNKMQLSSDPMLEYLREKLKNIKLGEENDFSCITDILKNETLFGTDLNANGMSNNIINMLSEMLENTGSVRKTLIKYL